MEIGRARPWLPSFYLILKKKNKALESLDGQIDIIMSHVSHPYKCPPVHTYREVKTKKQGLLLQCLVQGGG